MSRVVTNSGRRRFRVAVNGVELSIRSALEVKSQETLHNERIIAVRGAQLHLESQQRDVTDGIQLL